MDKGDSHALMSFRRGTQAQEFKVEIEKLFDVEGVLLQTPTLNVFEANLNTFLSKKDKKRKRDDDDDGGTTLDDWLLASRNND